jgi:tripartite-type tricarboxylate transporter receptor subunit TctC
VASIAPVCAQGALYKSQTLNLYIGLAAGGGYDSYGRLAAQHLSRFIPGTPAIVVQNMPGAGGLKVASYMKSVATRDGSALAMAAEAMLLEEVLQSPGVDYKSRDFGWIGRLTESASIFFTYENSAVKNMSDAKNIVSRFGSTGVTGITGYTPRALNSIAGTKFEVVAGYRGSAEVLLAMERGEVDGGFALWPEFKTQKPDWLTDKKINILYIVAPKRSPDLPNVPTTTELGPDEKSNSVLRLLASTSEIGRSLFTTPAVSPQQVKLLRHAFDQMVRDASFAEEALKRGLRIDPLGGSQLQDVVEGLSNVPEDVVESARAARQT